MNVKNRRYALLVIWIVSLMLIGAIIGVSTKSSVDNWYIALNRSSLSPPNHFFKIAWSILYVMIATSGWLIWHSNPFIKLNLIKVLYVIQLLLNWIWSPLFFTYHSTALALICLSLIIILVTLIIVKSYKKVTNAAILLIPYLLWLLFALHLNFYIWQYN